MLTSTGSTHGTNGMPLNSYAGRNHQGAGRHHEAVTKMLVGQVEGDHFTATPGGGPPEHRHPLTRPFGVAPMGESVARRKDLGSYELEKVGQIGKQVRGTYNGPFPHDETSPNAHCEPTPEDEPRNDHWKPSDNKTWVTLRAVVRGAATLRNIGAATVQCFKIDLKAVAAACTQMTHQVTQRWRQHAHWRWNTPDGVRGGFLHHTRCEWGQAFSGWNFHRSVTTLMVKWIAKTLRGDWIPTVTCPATRAWMASRLEMGLEGDQSVPGFVYAFLGGSWIFRTPPWHESRISGKTSNISTPSKRSSSTVRASGMRSQTARHDGVGRGGG